MTVDESTLKHINSQLIINATGVEVSFLTGDDAALIWLKDGSQAALAKANLLAQAAALNIQNVLAGDEVWQYGFGNPRFDARAADVVMFGPKTGLARVEPLPYPPPFDCAHVRAWKLHPTSEKSIKPVPLT